ncbi:hypothetical protein ACWGIV_02015 [Streptomyces sp. NPDC054844]
MGHGLPRRGPAFGRRDHRPEAERLEAERLEAERLEAERLEFARLLVKYVDAVAELRQPPGTG